VGTDVAVTFDYHSFRAEKARIGVRLTHVMMLLLTVATLVLLFGGTALVFSGLALGWALVGCAAIPAMVVEWKKGELDTLDVGNDESSIDELLDGDVLGLLPKNPSPYNIASVLAYTTGARFLSARFGVGAGFLQEVSSKNIADSQAVWDSALAIKKELERSSISAAILTVAMIEQYPQHEALMAHLQLTIDDLKYGVTWLDSLETFIAQQKVPHLTGGVARDWSFGWIPLLSHFGQNISQRISRGFPLEAHNDALDSLVQTIGKSHTSAVLVGPAGSGKTSIVQAFASRLLDARSHVPDTLKFRQVFMLSASSLVSSAAGKGELEALMTQILSEAYRAKNIIICLDDAQLFFEEGPGSVDISNTLLPIIKAANLPIILTMNEQRYLQISQRNSELAGSLARINVGPASRDETMTTLRDKLTTIEYKQNVTYMYQALVETYRLSERYVHDIAMPGQALPLLQAAADFAEDGLVTAASVQQAIEKTMDIKVGVASRDDEREKLLNLEQLIHERMINQTRAVTVVSDALRRARAGVGSQNRPIGTFLFLGPTGVGKTELAKALADVYFGGEDRMIRLDMNEFVTSSDVARLIADGTKDAGSLTSRVMKQPFSVVLLDEIEKAHPSVLATLLQLLDEGILRDERNREVSFRDAIVIATSNAGADRIREHIARGLKVDQFEDQFVDELIQSKQFAPEFLNRFDEIVMFTPLGKKELLQVVDLILADVNKTLSLQKVSVTVSDEAKVYLVEAGYDPRLGARPMRRVVQRAVENTVAKKVLSGEVQPGGVVEITLEQVQAIVSTKVQADEIATTQ
jgi:ATP-dependent Clp protease ATP-binding subunit ClpC